MFHFDYCLPIICFRSGAVDIEALKTLCKDMEKVSVLSKTHPSNWVSVGVIIEKSGTLKSSNGNEYMIWKLHDLKNCEEKPKKMLMFGEAVKEHWKLQKGSVVVTLSPQVDKYARIVQINITLDYIGR